jgi:hypothetical protein
MSDPAVAPAPRPRSAPWKRLLPWAVTVACFAWLYGRIAAAAARQGQGVVPYMAGVFAAVDWVAWLGLMIPYSFFFLFVDTVVLWRVVNWFNARVRFADLIPVRASTYIISIVNEQVGKGVMAWWLHRREGVPGWQVGSSMLFIMFCEFLYLLAWATIGVTLRGDALPEALRVFRVVPVIAALALLFWVGVVVAFRSTRFAGFRLRERQLLHAFRQASPGYYWIVMLLRSPALLAAVFVYSRAAGLFGVEIGFGEMLGILPLIFFGTFVPGPFRAVAVTLWPTLFAEQAGPMAAFGFVQHNFFVLFNAAIGLVFLRRANRELFGAEAPPEPARAGSA